MNQLLTELERLYGLTAEEFFDLYGRSLDDVYIVRPGSGNYHYGPNGRAKQNRICHGCGRLGAKSCICWYRGY